MVKSLDQIVGNLKTLPVLPEFITSLISLLDDPSSTIQEVSEVVVRDPSLSAQILKIVNSAFYGLPGKVGDITRAITILGFREIKNLVIAVAVSGAFKTVKGANAFPLSDFWRHSVVNASVCRFIAHKIHCAGGGDAFTFGLLHDIGKLVLVSAAKDELSEIVAIAEADELSFIEAERKVLETDHAQIGAWLLKKWNFPENAVSVVRHHHMKEHYESDPLTGCCYFGNYVATLKQSRCGGSFDRVRLSPHTWDMFGLERDELKTIIGLAEQEIKKADTLMDSVMGHG